MTVGILLGILLYADDIILLADCEKDLQNMLNIVDLGNPDRLVSIG